MGDEWPCQICKGTPTIKVKERRAGSKGHSMNSFAAEYRLCVACLDKVKLIGGIERYVKPSRSAAERFVIVKAKAWSWLLNLRKDAEAALNETKT